MHYNVELHCRNIRQLWMCMKHKDNSLQCMIIDLWDDPFSFIVTDSKRDIWIFQHPQSNYWMRLISCIIQTEVWVICQSRRLRQIHVTQTGGLIIHNILCELNSIIVLYIFQRICLKKTLLSAFAKVWENYTEKGPENLVYFELDMINAVSTADILLIECSLPIRLIILIPMWNITVIVQLKSLKRIMWNAMKKVLLIHCIWWIDLRHLNPKHTTVKPLLNNTVLTLSRLHLFSNSLYCLP